MSRKYFIMCLVCSLWTILQTSFHLVFVIYSYYMGICEKSPEDANSIFFYLTYLYNTDCSKPQLKAPISPLTTAPESYIFKFMDGLHPGTKSVALEEVVLALLEKIDFFPNHAAKSSRASVFLLCFIILDGAWIVSAVSLLMGTCFQIKESLSLVFYGPWLVMTICVSIFDATASVLFGFDIAETRTFSDWLDFVGVSDKSAFPDFDSRDIDSLTAAPSLAMCSVGSRFILIWLSNWIGFIFVMKATISVYRESYKSEDPHRPPTLIESPSRRNRIDHDVSAARIRNWQLFYGAVDTNTSTPSSKSGSQRDPNSNSKEREESIGNGSCDSASASGCYFPYPDVADTVVEAGGYPQEAKGHLPLQELRGQLPWSYTQPLERRGSGEENIELENLAKKHHRIKSDSSSSGTEL